MQAGRGSSGLLPLACLASAATQPERSSSSCKAQQDSPRGGGHHVAGTTPDVIEAASDLKGYPVVLADIVTNKIDVAR